METPEEIARKIAEEQTMEVLRGELIKASIYNSCLSKEELKKAVLEVVWGASKKPNNLKLYVFVDSKETLEKELEKVYNAIKKEYEERETSILDAKNLPPHILQYPLTPDELR